MCANLLCRLNLVMIEHLHIVLNVVGQFEREPIRRIENDLYIVGAVLIARMNADRGLLQVGRAECRERG